MPKRAQPILADLVQVLLRIEVPEIVLLRKSAGEFLIAVGSDNQAVEDEYIAAAVTKQQLADYQAERFDLRYLMAYPAFRRWWKVNLSGDGPSYQIKQLRRDDPIIRAALPDAGLFARGHDLVDVVNFIAPTARERFDIDGSWDLGEFSKFYGNVQDIYYMFNSLERFHADDAQPSERAAISSAFLRPWRGGGSYKGFYGDIANDQDRAARLGVSGIQYHSPGYVEVKARQKPFDEMIGLLRDFSSDLTDAKRRYQNLYKYLFSLGLLTAADTTPLSGSVADGLRIYAGLVAEKLGNITFEAVLEMANENVLVASKVVLSIFRRTEKLYAFFEEGRVHYEGLNAEPGDDLIDEAALD